jgi:hypothetical protein
MTDDWCSSTSFEFGYKEPKKKIEMKSDLADIQKKNEEYEKVFKAGGCSSGDMNITRHRKTTYINNYPCGTRCGQCGTFWID